MGLSKPVFRYIETELYNYEYTKRKLEESKRDIIAATPIPSARSKASVADPTAAKASRLLSNRTICRMEETLASIDRALQLVGDEHRTLFELYYRQGLRWRKVCDTMPTSRSTFFRLRDQLVAMTAIQMGHES